MKTILKSAMLFLAMVLTNTLTFAADKVPDVYVSRAPVSEYSGSELLNTTWFWILIGAVILVAITALISVKDQEETTHYPDHAI